MNERPGREAQRAQKVPAGEMPSEASVPKILPKTQPDKTRSTDQAERPAPQAPLGGERADNGSD